MANALADLVTRRNLGFAGSPELNYSAGQDYTPQSMPITNTSLGYGPAGNMQPPELPQGTPIEVFGRKGVLTPSGEMIGQGWKAWTAEDYASMQAAKDKAMQDQMRQAQLENLQAEAKMKQASLSGEGAQKPVFNAEAGGYVYPPSPENPQGKFVPVSGFQKPEKPLTEYQGQSVMFGTRAADAHNQLNSLEQVAGTGGIGLKAAQGLENVPLLGMAARASLSPEQQQIDQAQRNFVNAVLRRESGATISPSEFDNAKKQYFSQPGDSAAVIEQKRRNRELVINGFARGAGSGSKDIMEVYQSNPYKQQSKSMPSDADIQHTASKYGLTVDQVKQRLGLQ